MDPFVPETENIWESLCVLADCQAYQKFWSAILLLLVPSLTTLETEKLTLGPHENMEILRASAISTSGKPIPFIAIVYAAPTLQTDWLYASIANRIRGIDTEIIYLVVALGTTFYLTTGFRFTTSEPPYSGYQLTNRHNEMQYEDSFNIMEHAGLPSFMKHVHRACRRHQISFSPDQSIHAWLKQKRAFLFAYESALPKAPSDQPYKQELSASFDLGNRPKPARPLSSLCRLPDEIVDSIARHLSRHDIFSLSHSCALMFLVLGRRRWESVWIRSPTCDTLLAPSTLLQHLRSFPVDSKCVKALRLGPCTWAWDPVLIGCMDQIWRALPNLKKVELVGYNRYDTMGNELDPILRSMTSHPADFSLTHFRCRAWMREDSLLSSFLRSQPSIQVLKDVDLDHRVTDDVSYIVPNLRTLVCVKAETAIIFLRTPRRIRNLHILQDVKLSQAKAVTELCSRKLLELTLKVHGPFQPSTSVIHWAARHLTRLRKLCTADPLNKEMFQTLHKLKHLRVVQSHKFHAWSESIRIPTLVKEAGARGLRVIALQTAPAAGHGCYGVIWIRESRSDRWTLSAPHRNAAPFDDLSHDPHTEKIGINNSGAMVRRPLSALAEIL